MARFFRRGKGEQPKFVKLTTELTELEPEYDAVVIGTGYGGGVSALRLAQAGLKVCVLERGKEFLPGDFPETSVDAVDELQLTRIVDGRKVDLHAFNESGLYDIRHFDEATTVQGCGVGGTSLINANVVMPADPRVYQTKEWPPEVREAFRRGDNGELSEMDDFMEMAREMLSPNEYPEYEPKLTKMTALRECAEALKGDFQATPIAVSFRDQEGKAGEKLTPRAASGLQQMACNLCGNCCSGCNVGAKNTTAMNYLPDAVAYGAQIFASCKVSHISAAPKGSSHQWVVHFDILGEGRKLFTSELSWVRAKIVVVSAGTLGSSEIMLRSRGLGLPLSEKMLGQHYSGNGDSIGWSYDSNRKIKSVGVEKGRVDRDFAPGPCITGIADMRRTGDASPDLPDVEDLGFIVEDAIVPSPLEPLYSKEILGAIEEAQRRATEEGRNDLGEATIHRRTNLRDKLKKFLHKNKHYGDKGIETFLVMSHDRDDKAYEEDPDNEYFLFGNIELTPNQKAAIIRWPGVDKLPNYKIANDWMVRATEEVLDGKPIFNFLWQNPIWKGNVSVHSLGGCVMGTDVTNGVVNQYGQFFREPVADDDEEVETLSGLFAADGSIVPRSLGINPLLTITALSERVAQHIVDHHLTLENNFDAPPVRSEPDMKRAAPPEKHEELPLGAQFTESMEGRLELVDRDNQHKVIGTDFLRFVLTVLVDSLDDLEKDPATVNHMIGTVTCNALSVDPLVVSNGRFQLFVPDFETVGHHKMVYEFDMMTSDGRRYLFRGAKLVKGEHATRVLHDTTILYVKVFEAPPVGEQGPTAHGPLVLRGSIHIPAVSLLKQLTTIRPVNREGAKATAEATARFTAAFLQDVSKYYLWPKEDNNPPHSERALRTGPPSATFDVTTSDDVKIRVARYDSGGGKGAVLLGHGMGVSGEIFTTTAINTNLVEYLFENGYDVWVAELRFSIALMPQENIPQYTIGETALDWPSLVAEVRRHTGNAKVRVFGHCFGATALATALVNPATLPKDGEEDWRAGIESVQFSQVAFNPIGSMNNTLRGWMHLPAILETLGIHELDPSSHHNWAERILFRFNAAITAQGKCGSDTCRAITFSYGSLYVHDRLNADLHADLGELFGPAAMSLFRQLVHCSNAKKLLDENDGDTYMPNLPAFTALGIPVHMFVGEENECWSPEATEASLELLKRLGAENGVNDALFTREVIADYGHIDCIFGSRAFVDVFPQIVAHFDHPRDSEAADVRLKELLDEATLASEHGPFSISPIHDFAPGPEVGSEEEGLIHKLVESLKDKMSNFFDKLRHPFSGHSVAAEERIAVNHLQCMVQMLENAAHKRPAELQKAACKSKLCYYHIDDARLGRILSWFPEFARETLHLHDGAHDQAVELFNRTLYKLERRHDQALRGELDKEQLEAKQDAQPLPLIFSPVLPVTDDDEAVAAPPLSVTVERADKADDFTPPEVLAAVAWLHVHGSAPVDVDEETAAVAHEEAHMFEATAAGALEAHKTLAVGAKYQALIDNFKFTNMDPLWLKTLGHYAKALLTSYTYVTGNVEDPNRFVYKLPLPKDADKGLVVGIIGDWGTGTLQAEAVITRLAEMNPDVVIHLGDTYYSGSKSEMRERLVEPLRKAFPKDSGTNVYVVAGNHEYYDNGAAFYKALADLPHTDDGAVQEASHFALEYDGFVLQGADTSFNDRSPVATAIRPPLTRLVESEEAWHQYQLKEAAKKHQKTILFSHHMLFTSTSTCGTGEAGEPLSVEPYLLESFKSFFGNPLTAWFWGHDHNMVVYKDNFLGLPKGRLVGNSAIPVKSHPSPYTPNKKLAGQDVPSIVHAARAGGASGLQYNGFATLTLKGGKAVAKYFQVPRHSLNRYGKAQMIFQESF